MGNAELVKLLIAKGSAINEKTPYGWTPLHQASTKGFIDVVQILLEKGASINRDNDGKTPLHIACIKSHLEIIKILLDNGVNLDIVDAHGKKALEYADTALQQQITEYIESIQLR